MHSRTEQPARSVQTGLGNSTSFQHLGKLYTGAPCVHQTHTPTAALLVCLVCGGQRVESALVGLQPLFLATDINAQGT